MPKHREIEENKLVYTEVYRKLIRALEYEDNSFYKADQTGIYDACYYVEVNGEEFPIIGVKQLDTLDEKTVIKQHLFYWNRNDVPISVLILPNEFRVYNNFTCKKGKTLLYSSNQKKNRWVMEELKASRISTKVVWERLTELASPGDRVDKQLLFNLKSAVIKAHTDYAMPLEAAYDFMSQCIFVKYLEDRGMVTKTVFKKWSVDTFTELLEKRDTEMVYELFRFLKCCFNGDLFTVEKRELPTAKQLELFNRFFRGDDFLENGGSQLRLFPYDFSVIPIGLISNIYEMFFSLDDKIKREKKAANAGAFYTPHYLADFMVQHSFTPYENQNKVPSVLDPACGSGVFLVSAFKRQIRILKEKKGSVTADELSRLMTEKVFGIDINLGALRISCFSLYIALLDELTPKDIIENKFKFPNLIGNNLLEASFFSEKVTSELCKHDFDVIVGNPPWKSMPGSDHIAYCKDRRIPIADAQIAQGFISRAKDFAKETTEVSFLVTNAVFTNKNSKKYLNYLLAEFHLRQVINLEAIKSQLFVHAKYPCSILTYTCEKKQKYSITYHAFHSNVLFRLLNKFVYDKNDEIEISKHRLTGREYIWTILTYGDEFDVECIESLHQFPDLAASIKGKLEFVQGYITASNGVKCEAFSNYKGGSLKGCFSPYGLDYDRVPVISPDTLYDRTRSLSIYTCEEKVLIKRTYNEKCWGAAYVREPVIFSNDFSTFNDYSGENKGLLRYLEGILNSKVFRYYCFYMTKVKAAKKPEVVKEDVLRFPMPLYNDKDADIKEFVRLVEHMERLVSKEWEKTRGTLLVQDTTEIDNTQQILDTLVFQLYKLDEFQISIIEEGLNRFEKDEVLSTEVDYKIYSDYICEYFNYYMNGYTNVSWKSQTQVGDIYTAMGFSFAEGKTFDRKMADIYGIAGLGRINEQLLVQKQLLIFDKEGFWIIQTKEKSNWSLSRAKKMAIKITREIMMTGGEQYDA